MKTLLLVLIFAWICSRNGSNGQLNATQISGDWHTIAIAVTEIDMITDDGMLKLFFRHLECIEGCHGGIILTFYGESSDNRKLEIAHQEEFSGNISHYIITYKNEVDEECEKFEIRGRKILSNNFAFTYAGQHQFTILYVSSTILITYNYYLDADENLIYLLFLVGKGDSVSEEEQHIFGKLCDQMHIPKENVRYMLEKDICPK